MTPVAPTHRFSNRVEDYRKYRPGYPPQLVADLTDLGILTPAAVVADVGSGTGLLTRQFLEQGNAVVGVEPNAEMRAAGEEYLHGFARFTSVDATAETTTLPDGSIDLVVAGQAFHWFDRARTQAEFRRILRPGGWCVLIWNDRHTDTTPFLIAYEQLLRQFSTDYAAVDHKQVTDAVIEEFFAPSPVTRRTYPNRQLFDLADLQGRLLSSSYAPAPGHPAHGPMLARLKEVFHAHQRDGQVSFDYDTKLYAARE
jgi:SAM-dependent methyltransferase